MLLELVFIHTACFNVDNLSLGETVRLQLLLVFPANVQWRSQYLSRLCGWSNCPPRFRRLLFAML